MTNAPLRKKKRPVSMTDIADRVGCSVATVSRALSGKNGISPAVRRQVITVASEMGYVVNLLARDLRSATRRVVGFVVPDIQNPTYAVAAQELSTHIAEAGYRMVLGVTNDDPKREYEELQELIGSQAAGIVITPTSKPTPSSVALLQSIPTLEFNRSAKLSPAGIFFDDGPNIQEAVAYLGSLGYERILLMTPRRDRSVARRRVAQYRSAMRAHRLTEGVLLLDPSRFVGYQEAVRLFTSRPDPFAMIIASNELSLGVARAVYELGIQVPSDLGVVFYGDPEWTIPFFPPAPTIVFPLREMAGAISRVMLGMIADPQSVESIGPTVFRGEFRLPELASRSAEASPEQAAIRL